MEIMDLMVKRVKLENLDQEDQKDSEVKMVQKDQQAKKELQDIEDRQVLQECTTHQANHTQQILMNPQHIQATQSHIPPLTELNQNEIA